MPLTLMLAALGAGPTSYAYDPGVYEPNRIERTFPIERPAPDYHPARRGSMSTLTEYGHLTNGNTGPAAHPAHVAAGEPLPVLPDDGLHPAHRGPTAGGSGGGLPRAWWLSAASVYGVVSGNPIPRLPTETLLGGRRANNDFRYGVRAAAGTWFDDGRRVGAEVEFQYLARSRQERSAGRSAFDARSDFVGGGGSLLVNAMQSPFGRIDWLVGYRYLRLTDDLSVTDPVRTAAGRVRTENAFHGAAVGLAWERQFDRLTVSGRTAVAIGGTRRTTEINGFTATGVGRARAAGNEFSVVPEAGLKLGYQLTENVRGYAGYEFQYWSGVRRVGDQLDLRTPRAATAAPRPTGRGTDAWVHGLTAGVEIRF